ncbi:hypothetical protein A7K93_11395 [Candidatus Methylacidiphilum fumarolicum]|nr:hypothetical protein A7K93_11395 [Candidatus Methylacidiphilum fumarolicum]
MSLVKKKRGSWITEERKMPFLKANVKRFDFKVKSGNITTKKAPSRSNFRFRILSFRRIFLQTFS